MNYDKLFETKDIVIEDEKGKKNIKTVVTPKYKDSTKKQIFSPIRNKYLDAQPEEIVRQEFVCKLINDYGYSLSQMDEEVKLTTSQRGTGRASADIVVWKNEDEKKKKKIAFLVVELKAPEVRLKVEDCYQGYNYATWSRAKLFAISNSKELQVYKTVEEELPLKLQPVNDIPHIDTIQDDKKLEESLSKTKEFTGDEFAKLLHKCHNIIRNNDKLSPEASFDEISKILFIKIMYERNPQQERVFSLNQFETMKKYHLDNSQSYMQHLFNVVKKDFERDGIFEQNETIKLRERSFEQIVKELEIYNLTSTSADVKGIAFEKFLGRTFRGELGQFFTPRVIVDFIVDLLEPKENELICDPCAGSGGFLIKTFESIRKTIDDYYIELKRTKQKEIFGEDLENIEDVELQKQYEKFVSIVNKEEEEKIRKLSHESIFGTDANPRMARVSKMNMIMHGDGHNGIHHNDGLLNVNGIFHNRFDVIVTNPPFGTNLDKKYPLVEQDSKYINPTIIDNYVKKYAKELFIRSGHTEKYLEKEHFDIVKEQYLKEMGQVTNNIDKPIRNLFKVGRELGSGATEVLFIERCLDLLKPGGRMGIVLPEGVLNSSNLSNAREYFESRAKILLIVSMPQDIFISSGATVKTSLVFLKKFTQEEAKEYETIEKKVTKDIKAKYAKDIDSIKEVLKLRGKEALSATEKKIKTAELKELETKRDNEKKEIIKQKFDYEIPISDIKKAGITTTGAETDNELPELLKIYTEYRKANNLWEEK
ncbi:restriction endonuclease subunit M [Aliarcobacter butzleri]|uniref:restriction endonuclease subunit M n=1 Tax=Aliarcobacter butzleri TaxID=28197 RepID=UPI0021B29AF3|nr:N-6 DNA methylase [Aliarcobacter butzleri]MCT7553640.1 N-6 DNA methylase [Aliarcobacter butzleri]